MKMTVNGKNETQQFLLVLSVARAAREYDLDAEALMEVMQEEESELPSSISILFWRMELSEMEYADCRDPVLCARLRIALELEFISPEHLISAIRVGIDSFGGDPLAGDVGVAAFLVAGEEGYAWELIQELERNHPDNSAEALPDLDRAYQQRHLAAARARVERHVRDIGDYIREDAQFLRHRHPGCWQEADVREEICWQEERQNAFQWARDAIRIFSGAKPSGDQVPAI
jgi:hypothetical protein